MSELQCTVYIGSTVQLGTDLNNISVMKNTASLIFTYSGRNFASIPSVSAKDKAAFDSVSDPPVTYKVNQY